MAHDPRKPSWKNPGGGGKAPAPSQKREWHPSTPSTAKATGPRRRSLLWPALAGAVLLGLIVAAILLLRPAHMPRLVVVGPANAGTMSTSANVAGADAVRDLAAWAKEGKDRPHLDHDPAESVIGDEWTRGLEDGKEDAVVLFLSLHGGVDAAGEPFLWLVPPDAPEPTEKQKLRISTVITRLGQLPDKKRKLLVLDATQAPVSYAHGQLHNDFVRALKKLDGQIEAVKNLVVLHSSDDDQRSWISEEWQQSIFAHLFLEGAKGGVASDRVFVDKLFEYLQREVPAWTLANRGENQMPIILPSGSGMERAKKIEIASVTAKNYVATAAQAAPGEKFEILPELVRAWERRETLSGNVPAPDAIAPHLWRRHLDTLLRIEQMARTGLPSADVQARLGRLAKEEDKLERNPWPDLASVVNALTMPAAIGAAPPKTRIDAGRFQALWADPVNDWPNLLKDVGTQGDSAVARLRLNVCARLLDYLVAEDRPEHLTKAAALLEVVLGTNPAPVEAHLVRLLARDLDATQRPDWTTIKLALQVQRMAEEAALTGGAGATEFPSSEHVYPWLREAVVRADTERLRGLDHLISGDAPDWTKGAERLKNAQIQYETIVKQAKQVRQALAARNAAFAELPYYGRWVAGLRNEFTDLDSSANQKLLELVEHIAESAHRLSSMLAEANPARLAEMDGLARGVHDDLGALRGKFFAFIKEINGDVVISRWHHIDNALQVPFIPAKRRMELLSFLRGISHALNSKRESVGQKALTSSADARETAQRHGRVALALLGSAWVNDRQTRDDSGGTIKANFDELRQLITAPKPEWTISLGEAGEQIGRHWRALAGRIDLLTDKAARDPLDPAITKLAQADALARLADSTCAFGKEHDPVVDYRRYRLHAFLLNQARRSLDANWAAPELAAPQHFAEATATRFVNDAELLILMGAGSNPSPEDRARLLAEVTPMREGLKGANYTVTPGELAKDLTDQQKNFRSTFTIARPIGQSTGYPALRYESGGPARVETAASAGRRLITDFVELANPPASIERTQDVEVNLSAVSSAPGHVSAELWHRGHRIRAVTRVEMNREPSSIWAYKPPRGPAGYGVRSGADLRSGAVAILLDWSRSMMTKNAEGVTRYDQAVSALESVLASLPPGTVVSFRQFGTPGGADTRVVRAPRPYDFKSNHAQLDEIIKELRRSQPDGIDTPLARAIVQTSKEGIPQDFTGYRSVIALTDGDDNVDFGKAGQHVADNFGPNTTLKMVFFQATVKEETNARQQFAPILEMDPPGQFYTAKDKGDLEASLNDAMLPRVRTYKDDGQRLEKVSSEGRGGLAVTLHGSNLNNWSRALAPGPYMVRALTGRGKILLASGDRLLLELVRGSGGMEFRPRLYIPDAVPKDGRNLLAESGDGQHVHAGLANCRLIEREDSGRGYDLDLMLLLERERQPEEMQVTYPEFTWVEVQTQNAGQPATLRARLENEVSLPSPAYRIRVWDWQPLPGQQSVRQSPSRPAITVWWRRSMPGRSQLMRRDGKKTLAENFEGREFTQDGKRVKIESVRFDGPYLTLQVSHPPGAPVVFVRPEELKESPRLTMEEEHRFYEKTGKYTARFGPLSEEEQKRAFSLQFYSMAELKQDASKVELRPNVSPDVSDLLGQDTPRPVKLNE